MLLACWCQIYFPLCSLFFRFLNCFLEKKSVPPPRDPLLFKSATGLRKLMRRREVLPSQIIEAYIARIEEVNPLLNAVTLKNYEEAKEQALEADRQLTSLEDDELEKLLDSRPLFGLPFTVKDSLMIKGKVCTVGMVARKRESRLMDRNAEVVQRMFDAGAILLAVTTVPETCMWIETNTRAWGRTNNPYDSHRIVGGSSGGEGALQGAGASLMGVGSDLSGSIRLPAFCNGVFGFLPSWGSTPMSGHIPAFPERSYAEKMARMGPLTRFVEDVPVICQVLSAGKLSFESIVPLGKMRIFYCEGLAENKLMEPVQSAPLEAMWKAIRHFETKFHLPARRITLPEAVDIMDMQGSSIFDCETPSMACYVKDVENPSEPLDAPKELLKLLWGQSEHTLPILMTCLNPAVCGLAPEAAKAMERKREKWRRRIDDLLGEDGVLFYPSWPSQVPHHWETIVKATSVFHTGIVNTLLLTAVQCPMGLLQDGLPIGVQVIGRQGSDALLYDIATEISEAFGGWVPPGK